MERAERTGEELHVVLLDWEKAFDKITHTSLHKALKRYEVLEKIRNVIRMLYKEPTFQVNIRGTTSDKTTAYRN